MKTKTNIARPSKLSQPTEPKALVLSTLCGVWLSLQTSIGWTMPFHSKTKGAVSSGRKWLESVKLDEVVKQAKAALEAEPENVVNLDALPWISVPSENMAASVAAALVKIRKIAFTYQLEDGKHVFRSGFAPALRLAAHSINRDFPGAVELSPALRD
jgi:hypothetical protein